MRLRRLFPDPAELTPEEATTGLRLGDLAPPERPYLVLNMVSTLDGRIAIDGRSGAIGNDADREVFHGLRTQADAVMVGAGTVRAERYGRMVRSPEGRARREAEGLDPDPLAIVVSGRLNLPPDLPLLQSPEQTVLVITASDGELPPVPARVEYARGAELRPVLEQLKAERGVRSILCEGGPALNDSLLEDGLVDELFLSLAPKLAGGEPLTMLHRALPESITGSLVWLLENESHLFGRYRLQESLQTLD